MSITNLDILRNFLIQKEICLCVGEATCADGSCLLHAVKQNMEHLAAKGLWQRVIPSNVEDLRRDVIQFMLEQREYWTRPRFNKETQMMQTAPLDDKLFDELILDQRREKSWSDNLGIFVEGLCLFLDIQLDIICPTIPGDVSESRISGPWFSVNKADEKTRPIFYVGLLKDQDFDAGHYQFLKKCDRSDERVPVTQEQQPPSTPHKSPQQSLQRIQSSPSPLKVKRTRLISKYLQSPEKKCLFKEEHCQFCSYVAVIGTELEDHLTQSSRCLKYYLRNFKVASPLPIFLKLYNCHFCALAGTNVRLSIHLKRSSQCLNKYLEKFGVIDLKQLQDKMEKSRRLLRPSAINRKKELLRKKKKEEEIILQKTENDLINNFRKETSLSNWVLCHKCGANYNFTSRRIHEDDSVKMSEADNELKRKSRFEKFYCCSECFKIPDTKGMKMMQMEGQNKILIYPVGNNGASCGVDVTASVTVRNITCLLPCTVQCLDFLDCQNVKSQQQSVGLMYTISPDLSKLLPLIFQNEVSKYKGIKMFGDRYEGTILDSKTLKHAEKVVNDSAVVGSDKWRGKNNRDFFNRLNQLGSVCLHVEISLPMDQDDVIATIMLQNSHVVTVDYVGDGTNTLETKYFVHTNHDCTERCSESCNKVPLSQFLADIGFESSSIKTQHLSTYICSVMLKLTSFIRNFIKAPSSPVGSDTYHFELKFSLDNTVLISGEIWHLCCHGINLEIGQNRTSFDDTTKEELIKNADLILKATCDKDTLVKVLNISESEWRKLSKLIMKNQYHHCIGSSCIDCSKPSLPVLMSIVVEWSASLSDCHEFNKWILSKLIMLTEEQLENLSTEQWLIHLFTSGQVRGDIDVQRQSLMIAFGQRIVEFKIDRRLLSLIKTFSTRYPDHHHSILMACYHYSVSTVPRNDGGGVLLQRPLLKDIYIKPYNVSVLKAVNAKVDMKLGNGHGVLRRSETNIPHWSVSTDLDEGIGSTHQEVSLTEALVMFDKRLVRSVSSNPVEFIAAFPDRKQFFKKVKNTSEKSFKVQNSDAVFEHQITNIERFFLRCELEPKLCLCEFVMHYDFAGSSESKDLQKLFTKEGIEISDSEKPSAFSVKSLLKDVILLKNGDVMKLRTVPKVVAFPELEPDSPEHFFQQVLLYSPSATETMTNADVNYQYTLEDDEPVLDELGASLTIIQRIERQVLNPLMKSFNVTNLFLGFSSPNEVPGK